MGNSSMPSEERHHLQYLRDLHIKAQNNRCYFCSIEMTDANAPNPKPDTTATIEHLKGRASGGGSNYLNTAASCLGCNKKRSAQYQKGKRTVPVIRVKEKKFFTYVYTTPDDPFVLNLYNSASGRDNAMAEIRAMERKPITLKFYSRLNERDS